MTRLEGSPAQQDPRGGYAGTSIIPGHMGHCSGCGRSGRDDGGERVQQGGVGQQRRDTVDMEFTICASEVMD